MKIKEVKKPTAAAEDHTLSGRMKKIEKEQQTVPEYMDIRKREDLIGKYFRKYLSRFVFVEFSDDFLAKSKAGDLMKGVPVPLRKHDVETFRGGEGIDARVIGENMAWVMGCDPHFRYTEAYVEFLKRIFNKKIWEGMLKEGRDTAEEGDLDNACIHFRAALCCQADYLHGMYSYARACRAMYLQSSNSEYVAKFKKEAMDYFEYTTIRHPRFAQAYYFLGYGYLNVGLYKKAELTWKEFLKRSRNGKDKKEIKERLSQIEEPIRLEAGYTAVLAGDYHGGIEILEAFTKSRFNDWWPLHYYLGEAYYHLGKRAAAVASFKRTLSLNAAHMETMQNLVDIYHDSGDKENEEKYRKKMKLVEAGLKVKQEKAGAVEAAEKAAEQAEAQESAAAVKEKADSRAAERTSAGRGLLDDAMAEFEAEAKARDKDFGASEPEEEGIPQKFAPEHFDDGELNELTELEASESKEAAAPEKRSGFRKPTKR